MNSGMNQYVAQLIEQLTLEEKIGMIHGNGLFQTKGVARLGIPPFKMSDGPMGVRQEFENDHWIGLDGVDDFTTYLPSGSAIASTWQKQLAYQYGLVLGEEARGRGKDMILAPSINLIRTPLCGRNFEYLSEDTFLTSQMAVPMVKGIQSKDVSCCVKHFAMNNQEINRTNVDVMIDEKTLHETYLYAFRACVVDGHAYALMGAYNKINGEHCSQSRMLLNNILRDQWGYSHMVVSDWFAVHDTREAALSGIDIEMSVTNQYDDYFMAKPLMSLVEKGEIDVSYINDKVRNILNVMYQLKMIDHKNERYQGSYNTKENQQISYDIAKESVVLLKNEKHILPLSKTIKKVLVIGDNATRQHAHEGGSSEIKAKFEVTPLDGIIRKLVHAQVDFIEGYVAHDARLKQADNWQLTSLRNKVEQRYQSNELRLKQKALRDEALQKAKAYDHIIFFGGLNHTQDREGHDREDIMLPYAQNELIEGLLDINPNTVIYMLSGSAINMGKWHHKAKSILWSSYIGMHSGDVLADIIFGDVNPSGKLSQTFAQNLADYAAHSIGEYPGGQKVHYLEKSTIGYKHFQKFKQEVMYPFGYGLSYTTFTYQNLEISEKDHHYQVTLDISNTGMHIGKEVVQLYIKDLQSEEQVFELKGFDKIELHPHQTKKVVFNLNTQLFERYDIESKTFKVKHSMYQIGIGKSINEILLDAKIEV